MTWRVICDFDGTISQKDTTDQLLEKFAAPAWQEIEAQWVAGTISSSECMQRQLALVNVSKPELDVWLSQIEIDPAFVGFVHLCQRYGIDLSIASDGIDYVIRHVLARHGLGHLRVTANALTFLEGNRYALSPYHTSGTCQSGLGVCKCSVDEMKRQDAEHILYVGDGRSDFCASKNVELVMAKASLLTFCQQHALPHIAFQNFHDVGDTLMKLMAMHVPAEQPLQTIAA